MKAPIAGARFIVIPVRCPSRETSMTASYLVRDSAPKSAAKSAAAAAETPSFAVTSRPRLDSIDLLRGLVMVLMALDHTRDFFGTGGMNPRDVADPALFLTRWITHYCAPIFIFLAGLSASLYGIAREDIRAETPVFAGWRCKRPDSGRSTGEVSRFLLTRGFWLILIEFTLVRLGWSFSLNLNFFVAQVIWVIGASMVVLAGLVFLPRWAIAAVALTMIAGHNLLDGIRAEQLGAAGWLWNVLHQPAMLQLGPQTKLLPLYSLIPWTGVMAAGYVLGPVFKLDPLSRRRILLATGTAVIAVFIVLRATNLYGDPAAWSVQSDWLGTVLSFVNCEKYPPSLLYLMMTLGPALILLALFERAHAVLAAPDLIRGSGQRGNSMVRAVAGWITIFGRVPFLFYVAHIYLIHALAVAMAFAMLGQAGWLLGQFPPQKPAAWGLDLVGVYATWLCVVAILYPVCRWFASIKQRRREWWWSYV
jgi:uncharacterized membrane protein